MQVNTKELVILWNKKVRIRWPSNARSLLNTAEQRLCATSESNPKLVT